MPIEYQEHVVRENQDLIIFLIAFRYLRPVFLLPLANGGKMRGRGRKSKMRGREV